MNLWFEDEGVLEPVIFLVVETFFVKGKIRSEPLAIKKSWSGRVTEIDYDGNVSTNPGNEKFTSFEVGGEYASGLVNIKGSFYNTQWNDRNLTKSLHF